MDSKPGYKTTEFWLSLFAMLVGAVMASGLLEESATEMDNKIVGLIAMVLSGLGYGVSRAWTKSAAEKKTGMVAVGENIKKAGGNDRPL